MSINCIAGDLIIKKKLNYTAFLGYNYLIIFPSD